MYFVLSDIHGCITYLRQALHKFDESDCKGILLLGDLLNHGPRNPLVAEYAPQQCIALLNQYADKIVAVRGNCDGEVDQMVLNFPIMSDLAVLWLNKRRVILSHGHLYGRQGEEHFFSDNDIYLYGHFHIPEARREKNRIFLNPGSITLPKEGYANSYGLLSEHKFEVLDLKGNLITQVAFD